jgi:hypothetical protein
MAIVRLATSQVHTNRHNEYAEQQEPAYGTNGCGRTEQQTDRNCEFDERKDQGDSRRGHFGSTEIPHGFARAGLVHQFGDAGEAEHDAESNANKYD